MKIQKITAQHRRDFCAIYECEHCKYEYEGKGYDDSNFHVNVIPGMKCPKCGDKSPESYRALSTKYPDSETV